MQLKYTYILQQLLPMIKFTSEDKIELELETNLITDIGIKTVDIFIKSKDLNEEKTFAIEIKCYKLKTSTGGNRSAQDIFKKDAYYDLFLLEKYCKNKSADHGIGLVMTDYENYIYPKRKDTKSWIFDISQDAKFLGGKLKESIGGKSI